MLEDNCVNTIAFVEKAGWDTTAEQLFEMFKEMILPKDILLQYMYVADATNVEGYPSTFLRALQKSGFVSAEDSKTWFRFEQGTEKAYSKKLYVYHRNCLDGLKRSIWAETRLSPLEITQSEEVVKYTEHFNNSAHGQKYEWWM